MARYRRGVGGLLSDLTDDFGDMVGEVFGARDWYGDRARWDGPYDRWYGPPRYCRCYDSYPPPWAEDRYAPGYGSRPGWDGPGAPPASTGEDVTSLRDEVKVLARAVDALVRREGDGRALTRSERP
ncbi:hypothetical protein CTZ27_38255 [Streptomyces griseocarneus]|nr:hypothetical protein CTZ27_38255 [Streptomyces griseocarneus]